MPTGRIGLVDDCLDNFHAKTYLAAFRSELADRGWEVTGAFALQNGESRRFADEHRVPLVDSIDDLASHVDAFAILAPSSPQTHLPLCEQVLPYAKPTFVDKTFAVDYGQACSVFDLADRFATPVQTTSALRSTNIQAYCRQLRAPIRSITVWAGGDTFDEYGVHPVELVISCLAVAPSRLVTSTSDPLMTILLDFPDGVAATIHFNAREHLPFEALVESAEDKRLLRVDDSRLFVDAARGILDFFDAGQPLVPREQTLSVMRILDAAKRPEAGTKWVGL
ncbi:Oxidoreductase family, NAD-binding Rossmann fold [Posidoniimonas polymericola]|uniref:Oxidoreductase family, NAD-binding Rossmann fold n=1 Tax=Posidoniimonas polymericola TaxID=2528002 RepID=A0A5C5YUP9_9BACT|nr:Gfo/Idh/MocA family oxidoreductase [Posidoniimonas polymericola]TWT78383.1 Oxidoreductase family, NAD-binding Rossmann fold [Posidoniimonas polymericola]